MLFLLRNICCYTIYWGLISMLVLYILHHQTSWFGLGNHLMREFQKYLPPTHFDHFPSFMAATSTKLFFKELLQVAYELVEILLQGFQSFDVRLRHLSQMFVKNKTRLQELRPEKLFIRRTIGPESKGPDENKGSDPDHIQISFFDSPQEKMFAQHDITKLLSFQEAPIAFDQDANVEWEESQGFSQQLHFELPQNQTLQKNGEKTWESDEIRTEASSGWESYRKGEKLDDSFTNSSLEEVSQPSSFKKKNKKVCLFVSSTHSTLNQQVWIPQVEADLDDLQLGRLSKRSNTVNLPVSNSSSNFSQSSVDSEDEDEQFDQEWGLTSQQISLPLNIAQQPASISLQSLKPPKMMDLLWEAGLGAKVPEETTEIVFGNEQQALEKKASNFQVDLTKAIGKYKQSHLPIIDSSVEMQWEEEFEDFI